MSYTTLPYRRSHLAVAAIERGAALLGISGAEMYRRLRAQNLVRKLLFDGYDTLHTQSYDYVAETTVEALHNWETGR